MNADDRLNAEPLSPPLLRLIEERCDQFEAAARAGERPPIERFLEGVPGPAVQPLLRGLLGQDVDYRRLQGETPSREEYRVIVQPTESREGAGRP